MYIYWIFFLSCDQTCRGIVIFVSFLLYSRIQEWIWLKKKHIFLFTFFLSHNKSRWQIRDCVENSQRKVNWVPKGHLSSERSSEFRWKRMVVMVLYLSTSVQCMSVEIGLSANSTTVLNWFCSFTWKVFLWAFR